MQKVDVETVLGSVFWEEASKLGREVDCRRRRENFESLIHQKVDYHGSSLGFSEAISDWQQFAAIFEDQSLKEVISCFLEKYERGKYSDIGCLAEIVMVFLLKEALPDHYNLWVSTLEEESIGKHPDIYIERAGWVIPVELKLGRNGYREDYYYPICVIACLIPGGNLNPAKKVINLFEALMQEGMDGYFTTDSDGTVMSVEDVVNNFIEWLERDENEWAWRQISKPVRRLMESEGVDILDAIRLWC